MKGRKGATNDFRVPLSQEAHRVIELALPHARHGFLFPNARHGVISAMTLSRMMERRKLVARPHGFRSSLRDWLAEATDALGNATQYRYDSRNNSVAITDAMGNVTLKLYDGLNRLLEERRLLSPLGIGQGGLDFANPSNPDGSISVFYAWDTNSRLLSLIDDNGNATTYEYDALNRKVLETFADQTTVAYDYDADDNLINKIDQNGSIFTHDYDALNRLVSSEVAAAAGVIGSTQWAYTYDGLSRRTAANDNNDPVFEGDDATVEYRFNSLNQLLSESNNGTATTASYDGLDNRLSLVYPNGRKVAYSYDAVYNLQNVTQAVSGESIVEYDYAGRGRVLDKRLGNGTALHYHANQNDIGYDGINRSLQHRYTNTSDEFIAGFSYAFDKTHNRRFELNQNIQTADVYEYDSDYRLTRVAYDIAANDSSLQAITNNATTNQDVETLAAANDHAWLLDGVGNWVSKQTTTIEASSATGFISNEMNEYLKVGAAELEYDNNGNLVFDGQRHLAYDARNRLVRVSTLSGNTIASYSYDAFNRRTRKVAGSAVTSFLYFGKQVMEERNLQGQTQRQFVYGNGLDEVLQMRAANNDFYYHDNSIGSIAALTDKNGEVVERYRYTAYGEATITAADGVTERASSEVDNPYTFTGRRLDNETGLYYYRARYYSAEMGRFIQRDPLGYQDGMGWYIYVHNNPINLIDPLGTYAGIDDAIFTIGGALVGIGGQAISDFVTGNESSLTDYIAAGIGGAVAGETLLYAGPIAAGAAGGAAANITRQIGNNITGESSGFSVGGLAFETTVGAATGLIPGVKVPGITAGKGSFNSVFKQMVTKFNNGTISGVKLKTALKMFVGRSVDTSLLPGAVGANLASWLKENLGIDVDSDKK